MLSEINPEEPVTQNLMKKIIYNIQLEDEGYVCVYTRRKKKSAGTSDKDKWERGNVENIVSAIKEKGFNVFILTKRKNAFIELEDGADIEDYMISSVKFEKLDELHKNAYTDIKQKDDKLAEEYRDLFGMSQKKRKDFMGREMLKNIENYGQYVIIRWQK